mmetsp:Transcript_21247/g.58359  ORF Transcript_21247/g.58359 Transcript_21247/m.58359 type:complete len:257 (-) Transcript_21247:1881-2651(-)
MLTASTIVSAMKPMTSGSFRILAVPSGAKLDKMFDGGAGLDATQGGEGRGDGCGSGVGGGEAGGGGDSHRSLWITLGACGERDTGGKGGGRGGGGKVGGGGGVGGEGGGSRGGGEGCTVEQMQRSPSPSHSSSEVKSSTSLCSTTSAHSLQPRCSPLSEMRRKGFRLRKAYASQIESSRKCSPLLSHVPLVIASRRPDRASASYHGGRGCVGGGPVGGGKGGLGGGASGGQIGGDGGGLGGNGERISGWLSRSMAY